VSDASGGRWVGWAVVLGALAFAPGAALAQAEKAVAAIDQKDCEGAIDALNRGVADGEVRSMYLVGQMFEFGICLKVDPRRAVPVYERAATLGDAASARSLAVIHARGAGVPHSYVKAGSWFALSHGGKAGIDLPAESTFATPDAIAKTYVEAVHDLAEDTMVYPAQATVQGVRARVVMRFDPRDASVSVVSSTDNQGNATNHLGPNKHLFERALATSYDAAIKALPKPDLPATGDYATEHEFEFSRDRNGRDGPYGSQGLRR